MPNNDEVIICTLGTRGDIAPFLSLISRLVSQGTKVWALSNDNWRGDFESAGAVFEPIAKEDDPQDGRDNYSFFKRNVFPSFARSFSFVAERVAANREVRIIYRSNMLGAECAADQFRLRALRVTLQPSSIRSYDRPPWPLSGASAGPFGWLGRYFILPALYLMVQLFSRYRRRANAFRKSVGCAAERLSWRSREPGRLTALLCPEWFAMPQADWPRDIVPVGFVFGGATPLDPDLGQFLSSRDRPLVFTPGTGIADPAAFFAKARSVCGLLGVPGIFLSKAVPETYRSDPEIACRDFVDLSSLLPRCAALVHHGGIGSTAQAIRAGIPQMVIPRGFDQPDNALRVAQLGLGGAVLGQHFSAAEWARLLRKTLESGHVQSQLRIAKALTERDDPIGSCLDMLIGLQESACCPTTGPDVSQIRTYEAA